VGQSVSQSENYVVGALVSCINIYMFLKYFLQEEELAFILISHIYIF